jgi:serpin B
MSGTRRVGYALTAVLLAVMAGGPFVPAARAADETPVRAVTAAYNASGHDLFTQFAAAPGNIVFSPYSIGTAMAMVLSGARGETATQMATVLRHELAREAIDAANAGVLATLNGYDKSAVPVACPRSMQFNGEVCDAPVPANGVCPAGYKDGQRCVTQARRPPSAKLKAANALMLLKANGDLISPAYARVLKDKYRAEVFRGAGLDEINGWVNKQTEGKIEKILDQIDPQAPAVILNAVYFKAAWQSPFIKNATTEDDFRLTSSAKVKVAMMHRMGHFRVLTRPGYRAIRLPYSVDALSMVIVVPDDVGGATKLARDLDAPRLAALFRDMTEVKAVALALPRFKTSFKTNLGRPFMEAGMALAFNANLADFSGMTARPVSEAHLAISEIVHRAVIDVTEEGTEAAAATAIAMMAASAEQTEPFVVDRPFLFYIADETTGAILFQGRISDPRPPRS